MMYLLKVFKQDIYIYIKMLFFFQQKIKPYCFKRHHLKIFAEEIFAIDQF